MALEPDQVFTMTADTEDGAVVLRPRGDLDIYTAPRFESSAVAAAEGASAVVLDLAGVSFMDSSGMSALIALKRHADAGALPLRLRGVSPDVLRVLDICGMLHLFQVEG